MRNNEAIIKNSDFIPLIMKLGGIGENGGEINAKVFFTPSLKGRGKKNFVHEDLKKEYQINWRNAMSQTLKMIEGVSLISQAVRNRMHCSKLQCL